MGRRKKSLVRLQKSHKEWVERKHLEDQPSTSSSANVSTSDDILLPSTSVEVLEGDTSTLEKRMSLIRDVIGDKAMQINDKPNILTSADQVTTSFQAASPLCGNCLARLEICFDETPTITNIHVKCKGKCSEEEDKSKEEEEEEKQVLGSNETLILYCLEHGLGYTGYCDLMTYMKLKPVTIRTFYKIRQKVGNMIENKNMEKNEAMKKCVFHHYGRLGHTPDENGILNAIFGTKTPLDDETAFPRTPSGEVPYVPVKAH